ncbi:hypothetical protein DPEC_G00353170 [Dallia pectoralis]|uniref:Uncharacterized protein n=1 Tax=Dallia pectoralis TaxID=75939 RepID=A0ACC2F2E3_DALPE|nr:hypothetical protein DPEC_G00353170 [Dallia pectoralis]
MMNLSKSFTRASATMFHVQNGVGTYMHPGTGGSLFSFLGGQAFNNQYLASEVDVPFENVMAEPPVRPTKLDVNNTKSNVADCRSSDLENDEHSDDSLPCTPLVATECTAGLSNCPSGDEVLDTETRQLIDNVLKDYTGLPQSLKQSVTFRTMIRVVKDVISKHHYAYNGMISKLDLDGKGDDLSVITSVAKSLFSDGITNWGRIVSLVAFGAVVSQQLKERGKGNCIELVGQEISAYLLTAQRDWLVKNKSWDGFVEFFHVEDPESSVRKTLMAFAGVAGIGATLALLIRRKRLQGDNPIQFSKKHLRRSSKEPQ